MANKKISDKRRELETKYELEMMEFSSNLSIDTEKKRILQDYNRASSLTVGTAFGGIVELNMRTRTGSCYTLLQPVEAIELIHTLSAAVGCSSTLTPRDDFSSWRDWRVSNAEKNHLQGNPPHPNDIALVKDIGTSNFDQNRAEKISNIIANAETYVNQYDDTEIINRKSPVDGCDSLMIGIDGLIHNKVLLDENGEIVYVAGGDGGIPEGSELEQQYYERQANKKPLKTIKKPR